MQSKPTRLRWIRLLALIWGSLILAFVLFFLIAHIMEDKSAVMQGFRSSEIHIFLLFPISTIIGLSLAYKWPKLGGAITLIGIIGLMLFRPDLSSNPYFLFGITPPAILYFVYGTLEQRRLSKAESVEKLQ